MRRSGLDLCLGLAAAVLALSHLFYAVSFAALYPWPLAAPASSPMSTTRMVEVLAQFGQAAGFILLGLALLGKAQSRGRRWRAGAYSVAVGYAAAFVVEVISSVRTLSLGVPFSAYSQGGFKVAVIAPLALSVWSVIAMLVVAPLGVAKSSSEQTMESKTSDRRLAWVGLGFAVVAGAALANQIASGWQVRLYGSGGSISINVGRAATAFLFGAAVIGAVAFFAATPTPGGLDKVRRKRTLLALAAGSLFISSVLPFRSPIPGLIAQDATFCVAVLLALVGLLLSRRSLPDRAEDEVRVEPLDDHVAADRSGYD